MRNTGKIGLIAAATSMAAMSLMSGLAISEVERQASRKRREVVVEDDAPTQLASEPKEPTPPPAESRQVRRARERAYLKGLPNGR